jgi:hypothetical protein
VGLGARHFNVHSRNLQLSMSSAGERRSMGSRCNATRVWEGRDGLSCGSLRVVNNKRIARSGD